jgi:hypothetical protein
MKNWSRRRELREQHFSFAQREPSYTGANSSPAALTLLVAPEACEAHVRCFANNSLPSSSLGDEIMLPKYSVERARADASLIRHFDE